MASRQCKPSSHAFLSLGRRTPLRVVSRHPPRSFMTPCAVATFATSCANPCHGGEAQMLSQCSRELRCQRCMLPVQVPSVDALRVFVSHVSGTCDRSLRHLSAVAAFQHHSRLCDNASRAAQDCLDSNELDCVECEDCRQASPRVRIACVHGSRSRDSWPPSCCRRVVRRWCLACGPTWSVWRTGEQSCQVLQTARLPLLRVDRSRQCARGRGPSGKGMLVCLLRRHWQLRHACQIEEHGARVPLVDCHDAVSADYRPMPACNQGPLTKALHVLGFVFLPPESNGAHSRESMCTHC